MTCERSESAWEQRTALYKSDQKQNNNSKGERKERRHRQTEREWGRRDGWREKITEAERNKKSREGERKRKREREEGGKERVRVGGDGVGRGEGELPSVAGSVTRVTMEEPTPIKPPSSPPAPLTHPYPCHKAQQGWKLSSTTLKYRHLISFLTAARGTRDDTTGACCRHSF